MTLNEALEKCSDRWGEGLPLTFSYQNGEIDDLWQMLTKLKRLEKEQPTFISEFHGDMRIELGVEK